MKILAGNWKMFKTRPEAKAFFSELGLGLAKSPVRKIVAASPTLLETALSVATPAGVEVFSQNCAWAESGAFTGETSPLQLVELGVKGTLVGHSERRQYFAETDETCLKRSQAALKAGLDVIYCIGEVLQERQSGQTENVLKKQMIPVLEQILPALQKDGKANKFILAYEPVWAIGTGLTATTEQISEAHGLLARWLSTAGFRTPILYGGSVKPENIKEIGGAPNVSGGLVGGASLTAASYTALHNSLI